MDASKRGLIGVALTGVVVAGGGFAMTSSASAAGTTETRTVYAGDDAYTSSSRKSVNFGGADKLVVGRSAGETRVSYVKFSTGTLPAGAVVKGAELKLPLESKPVAARLSVHPVTGAWTEARITAATAPAVGSAIATVTPKVTDTTIKIDLSAYVKKAGTYSFALKSAATNDITRIRSLEYGDATSGGPEFSVTYTKPAATTPTKPPTTTPPTTVPPTTVPPTTVPPVSSECVTDALLVPSCGVLWGAAAGGFTDTPRDQALKEWEATTGRTSTIYHTYHKGDEMFPTKSEMAMTADPAKPRVLLLNWKIAYNTTWAKVAAGGSDARIDKWAAYVKKNYQQRFFLALHHEPENDVNPAAGSGMTAKDYSAMYRYVIKRLRAAGVSNMVNVVAYMGNEKWMAQSWWKDIYPGDDVVDWIGLDSYVSVEKGYYHYGMFTDLLHRQPTGGGTSWYDYMAKNHPAKPIMIAEWGMYHRTKVITDKAAAFSTVVPAIKAHPQIKAVVYFDTKSDDEGDRDISVDSTPAGLAAFKKIAADPMFNVKLGK